MDLQKTIDSLDAYIKKALKKSRYEHSLSVAKLARSLALLNGVNPLHAEIASLGHDMAKELTLSEMQNLSIDALAWLKSKESPASILLPLVPNSSVFLDDNLLHGYVGAFLLAHDFFIVDAEILEASAFHTTGSPSMGVLAKILYVADKLEDGRKHITNEKRASLLKMSLDEMVFHTVEDSIHYVKAQDKAVYGDTILLYNSLKQIIT